MKVALINSPVTFNFNYKFLTTQPPINLCYIASYIMKYGNEVEIWDYSVEKFSEEAFKDRLKKSSPHIVGISSMTPSIYNAARFARLSKEVSPGILTILGGPHGSVLPKDTLEEFSDFDCLAVGEGEYIMRDLCKTLEDSLKNDIDRLSLYDRFSNIRGLAYRVKKENSREEIKVNPLMPLIQDLDNIPFPARDLLNFKNYIRTHAIRGISRKFARPVELYTGRGCPNQCTFCAGHVYYGNRVRLRSVENILAEAEECKAKYGANHFSVQDDTFNLIPERVIKIAEGFKALGATWDCNCRVTNVSEKMLKTMADCGCLRISFGVESGSQRILGLIKKNITKEQIIRVFDLAHKARFKYVEGTFIVGNHPSETMPEIKETIDIIKRTNPDFITVSIITPYPGTDMYNMMKEKGYIERDDWSRFVLFGKTPSWHTDNFTAKDLVILQRKILSSFYLRPKYIYSRLTKIKNLSELKYWLETGSGFLKSIIFRQVNK